jgi:glyoxalase family protein
MVHTVEWRLASDESLDFWEERLTAEADAVERAEGRVSFEDPEGLRHALVVSSSPDEPLTAEHPEVPAEHALQGFDGVRVYAADPARSAIVLRETLSFTQAGQEAWEARADTRGGFYRYDEPPPERGLGGGGTVHHIAWSSTMDEHRAWHERVAVAGLHPSPIIDRFWFRSIYFREPSGVLFEIATLGPGFSLDEDPEHLGEALILPPAFEHLRPQVEQILTPLPETRPARR